MRTATNAPTGSGINIDSRVDGYPWSSVSEHLDAHGWAMLKKLLTTNECEADRVNLRHGVSRLRSGHRHTVGVIFHDAK